MALDCPNNFLMLKNSPNKNAHTAHARFLEITVSCKNEKHKIHSFSVIIIIIIMQKPNPVALCYGADGSMLNAYGISHNYIMHVLCWFVGSLFRLLWIMDKR